MTTEQSHARRARELAFLKWITSRACRVMADVIWQGRSSTYADTFHALEVKAINRRFHVSRSLSPSIQPLIAKDSSMLPRRNFITTLGAIGAGSLLMPTSVRGDEPQKTYYKLPDEFSDSGVDQTPSITIDDSDGMVIVTAPSNESLAIVDSIGWQGFALAVAKALITQAADKLAERYMPPAVVTLHKDAEAAIAEIVRRALSAAFHQHYKNLAGGLLEQLNKFNDTGKQIHLDKILTDIDFIILGITNPGYPCLSAYVMATQLHLVALKAKALTEPKYIKTFDRLRHAYARQVMTFAEDARRRLEKRIGDCELKITPFRPGEPSDASSSFTHDWGEGIRRFGPVSASDRDRVQAECERARAIYVRGGITEPIQSQINPIVAIAREWAK